MGGIILLQHTITITTRPFFTLFLYIILLIPAITYFREIFINRSQGDLLYDFTFWLVVGISFGCVLSLTYYLGIGFSNMFKWSTRSNDFYMIFSVVFIMGNIIFM